MRTELFNYGSVPVLCLASDDDTLWFPARNVCDALGIENITMFLGNRVGLVETDVAKFPVETMGGVQEMICVNEFALNYLIIRSNKPAAVAFMRWALGEVKPSVLKTGSYSISKLNPIAEEFLSLLKSREILEMKASAQAQVMEVLKSECYRIEEERTSARRQKASGVRSIRGEAAELGLVSDFWTLLVDGWKTGAFGRGPQTVAYFKFVRRSGGLMLFVNHNLIILKLEQIASRRGRSLKFSARELREDMAKLDYWVPSRNGNGHKQRMGGAPTRVWCIDPLKCHEIVNDILDIHNSQGGIIVEEDGSAVDTGAAMQAIAEAPQINPSPEVPPRPMGLQHNEQAKPEGSATEDSGSAPQD